MSFTTVQRHACLALIPIVGALLPIAKAHGQVIASDDAVGTQVENADNNRLDIYGGQISGDSANLFHSFDQFDIATEQTANFVTGAAVQNVIGRVNSDAASTINGALQVSGSNANLYLMNPAGVLLGPDAQLNLSGGFTATTATGIGFESGDRFEAMGQEATNYQTMVGEPETFHFEASQAGAVVNLADLSVEPGEAIALIGGTVVNTGELEAPEGTLTLAAVEGESLVRLSQANQLLSLEIETTNTAWENSNSITPTRIGEMLTGRGVGAVTNLITHADGTVSLLSTQGSTLSNSSESTISETGGSTIVSGNLLTQGENGGNINVLGNQVELMGARLNASGTFGGGLVRIGGEYQGENAIATATTTLIDPSSVISASALQQGNGGRIIAWADQNTRFDGNILARGGSAEGNGGFVEVSGKQTLRFTGNIDVGARQGINGNILLDPQDLIITNGPAPADTLITDYISSSAVENLIGNVSLTADRDITIQNLSDQELRFQNGTAVTFRADLDEDGVGRFSMDPQDALTSRSGSIEIYGAGITVGHVRTDITGRAGGDITIVSSEEVSARSISSNSFLGAGQDDRGGNVVIEANGGDLVVSDRIKSWSYSNDEGSGGDITLRAAGDILVETPTGGFQALETYAVADTGNTGSGGSVILSAPTGDVRINGINSSSVSFTNEAIGGGNVQANANNILINNINSRTSSSTLAKAGEITLAANNRIEVGNLRATGSRGGGMDNDIFLTGNTIDLVGGDGSVRAGSISLMPASASRAITIGQLTPTDLENPPGLPALNIWEQDLAAASNVDVINVGSNNSTGGVSLFDSAIANSVPIHVLGGQTLTGSSSDTVFEMTGFNSGNIRDSQITFSNIEQFNGGGGINELDYQNFIAAPITVKLDSLSNIQTVIGSSRNDSTLTGSNSNNNVWQVVDSGEGSVNGVLFSEFNNLVGGAMDDSFQLVGDGLVSGNISGQAGNNSLSTDAAKARWNITGENRGQLLDGGSPVAVFQEISHIESAAAQNTNGPSEHSVEFTSAIAAITGSITANDSDLTLIGDRITLGESGNNNDITGAIVSGNGRLTIRPNTSGTNITLGGQDGSTALSLTAGELNALQPGFSEIVIGDSLRTDRITLQESVSFLNSVVLRSQNNIEALDTGNGKQANIDTAGNITIESLAGSIDIGGVTADGGNATLSSAGSIELEFVEASEANGSLDSGKILIDAQEDFAATGVVGSSDASIQTDSTNDTAISIRYGNPGRLATAFTVGTPTNNGTAGNIRTGAFQIEAGEYADSYTLISNIELINRGIFLDTPPPVIESILPIAPQAIAATMSATMSASSEITTPRQTSGTANMDIVAELFSKIELGVSARFSEHLGLSDDRDRTPVTLNGMQNTLQAVEQSTGITPALVYAYFVPDAEDEAAVVTGSDRTPSANDQLEVMVITQGNEPIRQRRWGVTREQVEQQSQQLQQQVTSQFSTAQQYLPPAQQLYDWLISPLEATLQERGVDSIGFVMDTGLRTLPIATLHDGKRHLVENYSLGLLPTFSLTDFEQVAIDERSDFRNARVLAMGASEFDNQPALPAVAAEIDLITTELWQGDAFLNEAFSLDNLHTQLQKEEYGVLHLATHAAFESGSSENSYIQMWNDKLSLSEVASLNLSETEIGLIILSACSTALGDETSEYGFAGFAVNAGSQSALASLWPVSDEGTLGFMAEFYQHLRTAPVRAEALQQTQRNLIEGKVGIADGVIYSDTNSNLVEISTLTESGHWDFSHPFYWSAFTMIGNPW